MKTTTKSDIIFVIRNEKNHVSGEADVTHFNYLVIVWSEHSLWVKFQVRMRKFS